MVFYEVTFSEFDGALIYKITFLAFVLLKKICFQQIKRNEVKINKNFVFLDYSYGPKPKRIIDFSRTHPSICAICFQKMDYFF